MENATPYICIEDFKSKSESFFKGSSVTRVFKSSGTQGVQSTSLFSSEGIELYKQNSIEHIQSMLKSYWGENTDRVFVSWIPTTSIWPESSLAQMIEWFSEYWKESIYLPAGELPKFNHKPIWLFATALQLYNETTKNLNLALHPDSLIFETGGFKTSSYSFTKNELYNLITEKFGIPNRQVISEYGMAEFSCQAYEVYDFTKKKRVFSFSRTVRCSVLNHENQIHPEGIGCLIVEDPSRVDYPFPIRTQDIVELFPDQSFRLIGRVPNNILKGCSLLSETESIKPTTQSNVDKIQCNIEYATQNIDRLMKILHQTVNSKKFITNLATEFDSLSIAKSAIYDLLINLPQNPIDWKKAVFTSVKHGSYPKSWLIILPNNHSLVGIYPIILGTLLGIKLTIRVPPAFKHEGSSLMIFLSAMKKYYDLKIVDSSFLIGIANNDSKFDAIMAFGTDETVNKIARSTNLPLKKFGSHIYNIFVKDFEKDTQKNVKNIIKDAFSLSQKGCLSARSLIISKKINKDFCQKLEDEFISFFANTINNYQKIALNIEAKKFQDHGFKIIHNHSILIPYLEIDKNNIAAFDIAIVHSKCAFVLPIIYCENFEELISRFNAVQSDGKLNQTKWDGTHLNEPLFYI